ncbi:MAG: IS5 family transposase [Bacteroidales bacterium]|nr:IS5 family transposase [Bacteroidales bacterium]
MSKYKTTGKQTLFDAENAAQKLSDIGNPLEKLDSVIDFEIFRSRLEEAMVNHNTKGNAGAKQYDVVMMFKVMVLRQYYNLSYEQTEYQIIDRSSFKQFLGLASGDKVPDANTIRNFFEGLKEKGLGEKLFQDFVDNLMEKGFIFNEGQIVDASFVLAPRQRNTREENKKIKDGEGGDLWNDKPNKKRQKDIDASWAQKGGEDFFGYKVSAKVDGKSKFVKKIVVTTASPHDSKMFPDLMDESDRGQVTFADSAYVGQQETLEKYGLKDEICEKGYRGKPLTEEQREENRKKSTIRSRVEHVFGFMEGAMHGLTVKTVGIARATAHIFLKCLTYNMFRYEQFVRNGIR